MLVVFVVLSPAVTMGATNMSEPNMSEHQVKERREKRGERGEGRGEGKGGRGEDTLVLKGVCLRGGREVVVEGMDQRDPCVVRPSRLINKIKRGRKEEERDRERERRRKRRGRGRGRGRERERLLGSRRKERSCCGRAL